MKDFWLGEVIETFTYNFDGEILEIVKFHPRILKDSELTKNIDYDTVMYHCEELHSYCSSLQYMLLSWIAFKNLGYNNDSLVAGLSRALDIKFSFTEWSRK